MHGSSLIAYAIDDREDLVGWNTLRVSRGPAPALTRWRDRFAQANNRGRRSVHGLVAAELLVDLGAKQHGLGRA